MIDEGQKREGETNLNCVFCLGSCFPGFNLNINNEIVHNNVPVVLVYICMHVKMEKSLFFGEF